MRSAHVLLQLALIVAALFVYDTLRDQGTDTERAGLTAPVADARGPSPRAPSPDAAPDPAPDLGRRLALLIDRVSALEAQASKLAEAVARGTAPPPAPAPVRSDDDAVLVPPAAPVVDSEFSAEEIARFRALRRAAQRQQRLEQVREQIGRRLDETAFTLAPQERERVVEAALRAWLRAEPLRFRGTRADAKRTSRDLKAGFRKEVGRIVRGSYIDAIVDHLAPTLGLTSGALQRDDAEE